MEAKKRPARRNKTLASSKKHTKKAANLINTDEEGELRRETFFFAEDAFFDFKMHVAQQP